GWLLLDGHTDDSEHGITVQDVRSPGVETAEHSVTHSETGSQVGDEEMISEDEGSMVDCDAGVQVLEDESAQQQQQQQQNRRSRRMTAKAQRKLRAAEFSRQLSESLDMSASIEMAYAGSAAAAEGAPSSYVGSWFRSVGRMMQQPAQTTVEMDVARLSTPDSSAANALAKVPDIKARAVPARIVGGIRLRTQEPHKNHHVTPRSHKSRSELQPHDSRIDSLEALLTESELQLQTRRAEQNALLTAQRKQMLHASVFGKYAAQHNQSSAVGNRHKGNPRFFGSNAHAPQSRSQCHC
ncbi:hypothetical protein CAOG_05334, partial [Capsaspora owczarzaki ATCC 30864]|uniref:hypothetical protein n=1 Tax=Capsaspora owczarzaki (strain ATCC 30864) TaxID=595528 RepID=UPI0003520957